MWISLNRVGAKAAPAQSPLSFTVKGGTVPADAPVAPIAETRAPAKRKAKG